MKRAALFLVFLCCSCDNTALARVTMHLQAGGVQRDASQPLRVRTPSGWDVELRVAQVSVGALYLFNAVPDVGTGADSGRVVGQCLASFTLDALDPTLREVPAPLDAVTEPALAARLVLVEAPEGPIADAGGSSAAVAHLAGTATRAGVTVQFDGVLTLPLDGTVPAWQWVEQHQVRRLLLTRTPNEQGVLALRVDPTHWLDAVDFASLPGAASVAYFDSPSARAQLRSGVAVARTASGEEAYSLR